jgi:hypothetical protein
MTSTGELGIPCDSANPIVGPLQQPFAGRPVSADMKSFAAIGLIVVLSCRCAGADSPRIVCIGDSITQGSDHVAKGKPTQSWRYPLWKLCCDAGFSVTFVGSMTTGFEGSPAYPDYHGHAFSNVHEARWGWPTDKVNEVLHDAAKSWVADIAIILLGDNDKDKNTTLVPTMNAMKGIVDTLRGRNKDVKIAIAQPYSEWKPMPAMATAFETLAKELNSATSPVISIATSAGWISNPDLPGTCTVDWVHPNAIGDERLGLSIFNAIHPWLDKK